MLNQNLVNNERAVDRVKVSSAGTAVHPYLGSFPTIGCFPLPVTKTGTFTTDNSSTPAATAGRQVIGTGTLFLSELQPGDFLYNAGKLRRVLVIYSDTMLLLENAFPTGLTAQAVAVPPLKHYKMITAKSVGTADATLQEQLFAQGEAVVEGGTPLSYDVSTSNAAIEFTASR